MSQKPVVEVKNLKVKINVKRKIQRYKIWGMTILFGVILQKKQELKHESETCCRS